MTTTPDPDHVLRAEYTAHLTEWHGIGPDLVDLSDFTLEELRELHTGEHTISRTADHQP